MTQVQRFTFNSFFENTYVLYDETQEAVIIDPGMCYEGEDKQLFDFVEEKQLKVVQVLLTHAHLDHILGLNSVFNKYGLLAQVHKNDLMLIDRSEEMAFGLGYEEFRRPPFNETTFFSEEGELVFGNTCLQKIFCPGHAPGHICFFSSKDKFLIGGDVLFYNSIGRTDLPGGNYEQLISNIKTKIFTLPDETIVYTGHGEPTTVGREKAENPFFTGKF